MKKLLALIIFSISFLSVISLTPEPTVIVIEGTQGEQGEKGEQGNLGVSIPSGTALFETSLLSPITSTAVTMTVRANSVSGGNTLSGYQCFTIDEGSAQAEFVCGTISGTTISSMTRGVDPITATSSNSTLKFAHRRGANVKITDFPLIQVMRNVINGGESFPNALTFDGKLTYSTAPTFSNALDITTKDYADAIANQGAATATTDVAGISEEATSAELAAGTAFGVTEPHYISSEYGTTTPNANTTTAVPVTILGKLAQAFWDLTASFSWTGEHTFSATTTVTSLIVSGDLYNDTNIVTLTASTTMTGATLPQPVYLANSASADAGGILLADANDINALDFIGFVISNSATGTSAYVQTDGIVDGFTGLTKGAKYYVQDAVGTIGTTAGTYSILVGKAISATEILFKETKKINIANSVVIRATADTERSTQSITYVKLKEIKLNNQGGTIHTTFTLIGDASYTAYGIIYKNGVAVGTERSQVSATPAAYTETFTVAEGDLIQLYSKVSNAAGVAKVSLFKIGFLVENKSDAITITD